MADHAVASRPAAAPPQVSADGKWYWDGRVWRPAITPDGRWRWDGRRWMTAQLAVVTPASSSLAVPSPEADLSPVAPAAARHLPLWLLIALLVLDLTGFIPQVAFLTSIGVVIVLLIVDARGFVSMNGWIKWKGMNIWLKILLGFLEFGLCEFVALIYLLQRIYPMLVEIFARGRRDSRTPTPPTPIPFNRLAIESALQTQIVEARQKLPADQLSKVQAIADTIRSILPRYQDLASDELYAVVKTATEYLPGVLQPYFKLPGSYVSRPLQEAGGKTAQQVLSEQLDLLSRKINDVSEALHKKDVDSLLSHEKFLETEFGKSSLPVSSTPLDPDAIQSALDAQLAAVKDRLPDELMAEMQAVAGAVRDVLPAYRESELGPQELFVIQRTVDDYLPSAVQTYLKLPAAYVSIPLPEADGKTATQVLSDQLDLLTQRMRQVADAAHQKDVEALLVHGRFLEDKFGASTLALNAQG